MKEDVASSKGFSPIPAKRRASNIDCRSKPCQESTLTRQRPKSVKVQPQNHVYEVKNSRGPFRKIHEKIAINDYGVKRAHTVSARPSPKTVGKEIRRRASE